jgi:hypothetical protein
MVHMVKRAENVGEYTCSGNITTEMSSTPSADLLSLMKVGQVVCVLNYAACHEDEWGVEV